MKGKKKTRKPRKERQEKPSKERDLEEIPGQVSITRSPFKLTGKIKYLSTDIDSLHKLVLEKGVIKLADAAKRFKTTKKNVEDWGNILEDHKMIEMHYPVAGEPTLMAPGYRKHRHDGKNKPKEKKKGGKPHLPKLKLPVPRLTRKRMMIMAEVVILGELLIYIFMVNPHLRNNFIPTLNYQISNLPANIMNLPAWLSGLAGSFSGSNMLINPIYFVIAILLVVFWVAVVMINRRKKKAK